MSVVPAAQPVAARPIRRAGGVFAGFHEALAAGIENLPPFVPGAFSAGLLAEARAVWLDRVHTEYRSVQIMAGFLNDVLAAGDPLDVYAGAIDLVADEVRHVAGCAALCSALGITPTLPDPVPRPEPAPALRDAPAAERALHTAISMLLVSEAISVGFIEDLKARCTEPAVSHVLAATLADETGHEDFGRSYVSASLRRFPPDTRAQWLSLIDRTLDPHRRKAHQILSNIAPEKRDLAAWPEPERAALGLFSPVRQALVYLQTEATLKATLQPLDLWPA